MQRTLASARTKGRRVTAAVRAIRAGVAVVFLLTTAAAREALRVRADTELVNLGSIRTATTVEVSGGLRDDAGHPIADAAISLPLTLDGPRPTTCRPGE